MAARGRLVAALLIFVGIPLAVISEPSEPSASSSPSSSAATVSSASSRPADAERAARRDPARTGSPGSPGVSPPADTRAAADPATPAGTATPASTAAAQAAAPAGTPAPTGTGSTAAPAGTANTANTAGTNLVTDPNTGSGTPAGPSPATDPATSGGAGVDAGAGGAATVPASGAAGQTPSAGGGVAGAGEGPAAYTREIILTSGRSYDLHTTTRSTQPRPLVVLLHAYAHDAAAVQDISGATPFADAHDFALVYGHAVGGAWNAGGCCAGTEAVDDVAYLRELVADASRHTPVDPRRVYVWGYSNGGMMAARAVCEAPDVFSAAGVVAGHLLVPCDQTPIRMIHIHGTDDTTVPWRGGWSDYVHVTFPDARTESARVTTSSTVLGVPWIGGHTWPWWATGALWEFSDQPLASAVRAGFR